MQVIEGWKWIEERVGVVFFPVGSGHEFYNGLGIFNNMSVALLAKDSADGLNFSFPLVRSIVEQDRSIIDDGVGLALLNRLKSILHFRKFRWINIVSSQIFRRGASLHGGDALAGKVFGTV